jgi:hypothetical protein
LLAPLVWHLSFSKTTKGAEFLPPVVRQNHDSFLPLRPVSRPFSKVCPLSRPSPCPLRVCRWWCWTLLLITTCCCLWCLCCPSVVRPLVWLGVARWRRAFPRTKGTGAFGICFSLSFHTCHARTCYCMCVDACLGAHVGHGALEFLCGVAHHLRAASSNTARLADAAAEKGFGLVCGWSADGCNESDIRETKLCILRS